MEKIEVTGKTVEEALTNALLKLETTSDKVEYEVLEKGSSGILGIFNSKPAKILIWKKATMEDNVRDFLNDIFGAMKMEMKKIQLISIFQEKIWEFSSVREDRPLIHFSTL